MTDAQTLTATLHGKWYRRYGMACCPAHDDQRPSLTLADAPDGRLLLNCKAGCNFTAVLDALRNQGFLEGSYKPQPASADERARREAKARADAERAERKALACWRETLPIHGTIAETYLRGRGITGVLPDSLQFHPACWHPQCHRIPAMVARVDGLLRLAVHRTYLAPFGSGKADAKPARAMLGTTSGGHVEVAGGRGPLVVAEGIETALSLCSGLLARPATIWAALSTSGLAALRLPIQPGRLTIASDGDAAGHAAAHKLANRAAALGWAVSFLAAPEGRDWNDVLQLKGDKP